MSAQVRAGRRSLPVPRREHSTFIVCADWCPFKQFKEHCANLSLPRDMVGWLQPITGKTGLRVTANVLVSTLPKGNDDPRAFYICHTIMIKSERPGITRISPMPS